MQRTPEQISAEIIDLVSELAKLAGGKVEKGSLTRSDGPSPKEEKDMSGATGGIRMLIDEGKLDSPKKLPEVVDLLKQEGRHYSSPTVSMGLLNLVRERVLTRLKDAGEKNWKYAVRR
jgi:hypothetical protein